MKASFYTLFRRRERENQKPEELFAVAAIAFCLRHDKKEFGRSFLRDFCGLNDEQAKEPVTVEADTHKWGDLVIKSQNDSFVCVLEFKIRSQVSAHQNPNSPTFSYANDISKEYRNSGKKFYFIITTKEKVEPVNPSCREQRGVNCQSKCWDELAELDPNSELIPDLFECFGDLGVDIFRERQLKNMKLTDFALGSKKVIHALELIYRRLFGKRLWVERMDDEGSADDCWSTGVYIPEDLSEQFEGWYGFEGKKQAGQPIPRSGCAVVYFYCHDSPKKESDLKTRLKKKGFKTEKVDSWDKATLRNVVVRNYEGEKELSWFESVYKAVGAIK